MLYTSIQMCGISEMLIFIYIFFYSYIHQGFMYLIKNSKNNNIVTYFYILK